MAGRTIRFLICNPLMVNGSRTLEKEGVLWVPVTIASPQAELLFTVSI